MLDVFVREVLARGALGEAHAFAQGAVVGFGVSGVEDGDGVPAVDAYWHCGCSHGYQIAGLMKTWVVGWWCRGCSWKCVMQCLVKLGELQRR